MRGELDRVLRTPPAVRLCEDFTVAFSWQSQLFFSFLPKNVIFIFLLLQYWGLLTYFWTLQLKKKKRKTCYHSKRMRSFAWCRSLLETIWGKNNYILVARRPARVRQCDCKLYFWSKHSGLVLWCQAPRCFQRVTNFDHLFMEFQNDPF